MENLVLSFSELLFWKKSYDGSACCRRPWSKARCFYGFITSCGHFDLVVDATTELHSIKVVVASTATGGKGDPLPTDELQSEMGTLLSPHLASEVSVKRGPKAAPESSQ